MATPGFSPSWRNFWPKTPVCARAGTLAILNSPHVRAFTSPDEAPKSEGGRERWPQIDRYRLVRVLGEGGMGTVYEEEQQNPRRRVALMVFRPGLVSPRTLKRFAQEVQILGRLDHPASPGSTR